jgi:plasmid replication initiation protein
MSKSDLVVKTNQLNSAVQNLSLPELRIIQLAIVDARETGKGLDTKTPLRIDAMRYAQAFDTTRQNAYILMKQSEETLFNRRFTYFDNEKKPIKSRWLQDVRYLDDEGAIEVCFTRLVVECITRLDGAEQFFTQYMLSQTANLNSAYSVRLYELLIQWKAAGKTPVFELSLFRGQMGLNDGEYKAMNDFKKRVLDLAVNEINDKTDLTVSYIQEKKGRLIHGFKFTVKPKDKPIKRTKEQIQHDLHESTKKVLADFYNRDPQTVDMFTKGLTDKQIARVVHSKKFMADYGALVSPSNPANQSSGAWVAHMVDWFKKDAINFNKRPIQEYLDDEQAPRF